MGGGRAWGEEPDTFSWGGRNIGGKWEEVEFGKRNRILFPEEEILVENGRRVERGAQDFGKPLDVNVSNEGYLRRFSAEVSQVRSSYTGRSLDGKGLILRTRIWTELLGRRYKSRERLAW